MRIITMVLLAATLVACSRKVEVGSAPSPSSGMAVHLTNNSSQAVNAEQREDADGVRRVGGKLGHAQGAHGRWVAHVHERQRLAHVEHRLDGSLRDA